MCNELVEEEFKFLVILMSFINKAQLKSYLLIWVAYSGLLYKVLGSEIKKLTWDLATTITTIIVLMMIFK